jgi:hypothetical protein
MAMSMATAGAAGWSSGTAATTVDSAGTDERTDATRTGWRTGVVDGERFVEIAGWFVVVGATMGVLGFVLPWSSVVIGASGVGGYFDTWGLASPTHLFVLLALLAVLALGVIRSPLPDWIRFGLFGLGLGNLLIGLTWPYLASPLGADVGVTLSVLGGLTMVIGGVVASWASRHAAADPLV